MINVKEILEIENKRKKIKKEIYTKIYEQFCKKIRMAVDMGAKSVELSVPNFLLGYPTFDQTQAAVYLKRQLTNAGFKVLPTGFTEFRVTWEGSKSQSPPPPPVDDSGALPSLINLKKLASKHRGA
jgi:hypothetical protein